MRFQEIDEQGREVGKPSFGILASDNYEQGYTDAYDTREELEQAITEAGSILAVVGGFDDYDADKIGKANYFGTPTADDEDEDGET